MRAAAEHSFHSGIPGFELNETTLSLSTPEILFCGKDTRATWPRPQGEAPKQHPRTSMV